MSAASAVSVTGATGAARERVNGMYDFTKEEKSGELVFRKRGDVDISLQYNNGTKEWIFRDSALVAADNGWAYVESDNVRFPVPRPGSLWQVFDYADDGRH